jgi:hypothetical protein
MNIELRMFSVISTVIHFDIIFSRDDWKNSYPVLVTQRYISRYRQKITVTKLNPTKSSLSIWFVSYEIQKRSIDCIYMLGRTILAGREEHALLLLTILYRSFQRRRVPCSCSLSEEAVPTDVSQSFHSSRYLPTLLTPTTSSSPHLSLHHSLLQQRRTYLTLFRADAEIEPPSVIIRPTVDCCNTF